MVEWFPYLISWIVIGVSLSACFLSGSFCLYSIFCIVLVNFNKLVPLLVDLNLYRDYCLPVCLNDY